MNFNGKKNWFIGSIAVTILLLYAVISAAPALAGSDNNVGRHLFKINIIGRPNTWSGDDTGSNSKTLFISIFYERAKATCEPTSGVTLKGEWVAAPEPGQRIYFYEAADFEVVDRDATDGQAVVTIPYSENGYEIFVRILGGSNKNFPGCLDADAYQYLPGEGPLGEDYYWIGHLDANRKPGQPEKVNVRSLFYDNGNSYFSDVWNEYFWSVQNNGLRNMQLIFYESAAT